MYNFFEESDDQKGVCFSRKKGEINQFILVDNILDNYLRLTFQTTSYQHPSIDGYELLCKKGELKNTNFIDFLDTKVRLWKWEEKSQFLSILDIFNKIIVTYGLITLDELSVDWTDIKPTEESNRKLYEKHAELNLLFRKQLKIEREKDSIKVLEAINKKLHEFSKESFKNIEDQLIGLAAVYGEEIVLKCGGKWELREDLGNHCWISNIHGNMFEMEDPLSTICDYMSRGCDDIIVLLRILKI